MSERSVTSDLPLFALRPIARSTDPTTSHEAARSVKDYRVSQLVVLGLFEKYGAMTDEQLAERYAADDLRPLQSVSGLRTRRCELVQMGKLRDSGNRSRTQFGRPTILWEVAAEKESAA